jgi:hypothetical protein
LFPLKCRKGCGYKSFATGRFKVFFPLLFNKSRNEKMEKNLGRMKHCHRHLKWTKVQNATRIKKGRRAIKQITPRLTE